MDPDQVEYFRDAVKQAKNGTANGTDFKTFLDTPHSLGHIRKGWVGKLSYINS